MAPLRTAADIALVIRAKPNPNIRVRCDGDRLRPDGIQDGNDIADDDRDRDGMSDAWEQQIVDADAGDGIQSVEDVLPADDFDGDGLSNLKRISKGL